MPSVCEVQENAAPRSSNSALQQAVFQPAQGPAAANGRGSPSDRSQSEVSRLLGQGGAEPAAPPRADLVDLGKC
ncbi:hypothetical protein HispidOSU_021334 [Sigmodon hispidus]